MKAPTLHEMLSLLEARPVQSHVHRVAVLECYAGPPAYFSHSVVISPGLWNGIQEAAEIVQHDIGASLQLGSLPVLIIDSLHPEFERYRIAMRSGLFAKITNSGGVTHE